MEHEPIVRPAQPEPAPSPEVIPVPELGSRGVYVTHEQHMKDTLSLMRVLPSIASRQGFVTASALELPGPIRSYGSRHSKVAERAGNKLNGGNKEVGRLFREEELAKSLGSRAVSAEKQKLVEELTGKHGAAKRATITKAYTEKLASKNYLKRPVQPTLFDNMTIPPLARRTRFFD